MTDPCPCEDPSVVHLPSAATVSGARELYDALARALERGVDLELDGASVARVDVTALQLLVAVRREADRRGLSVRWRASSDELRAAATLLNLAAATGLSAQAEEGR